MSSLLRPTASAAGRALGRPTILDRGSARRLAIALTFDDGPGEATESIARTLEQHGCRGTFFVLGPAVEEYPEVVRSLVAAGHEVGNHLWSHRDPADLSHAAIRNELRRTMATVRRITGVSTTLLRPPYCSEPRRVALSALRTGVEHVVLRSIDPADWRAVTTAQVVDDTLASIGFGDIVCLHDGVAPTNTGTSTRAVTAAAVAALLPILIERGLQPVTVSELLRG
jgi:peptidoglycan/xylan/chitin deacetylase (PgdA/CDA1 family)